MTDITTPSVYVGTYHKYNCGSIAGAWLDLTDFDSSEEFYGHCCKVSDEAAFCLIQRPYISKTLLT
ncbi:antirestriction protein ArdA, partial [Escherichia coli]|nr:antirestriction protein ArdA [Escherichia coli]